MVEPHVVDSLLVHTRAEASEVIGFLDALSRALPSLGGEDVRTPVPTVADTVAMLLEKPQWKLLSPFFTITGVLAAFEALPRLPLPPPTREET